MFKDFTIVKWMQITILSFLFVGCDVTEKTFPEDFREWEIEVVSPSFYPVMIDQVYGVNEEEDWTIYAKGYGHHTWRRTEFDRVKERFPDYDGFGIPLHKGVSTVGRQSGSRTLPESIYIYWASLAEGKLYVNKFYLTPEMQEAMMEDHPEKLSNGNISHCYQKNIYFGLLPGGTAKVWRMGCGNYTYMGKVEAAKKFDEFGHNEEYYNIKKAQAEQRAADNGVNLFPIPYAKLDQVFHYDLQKRRCAINKEFWGCS